MPSEKFSMISMNCQKGYLQMKGMSGTNFQFHILLYGYRYSFSDAREV